jgi:tetratricopeptide (TPR) repeat protein
MGLLQLLALSNLELLLPESNRPPEQPTSPVDDNAAPNFSDFTNSIFSEVEVDLIKEDYASAVKKLEILLEWDRTQVDAAAALKEIDNRTNQVNYIYEELAEQIYQEGETHFQHKRWPEALICFEQLRKSYPPSPDLDRKIDETKRQINLAEVTGPSESLFPGLLPWLQEKAAGPVAFLVTVLLILSLYNLITDLIILLEPAVKPQTLPLPGLVIPVARVPLNPASVPTAIPVQSQAAAPQCQVVTGSLALLPGPGAAYGPAVANLASGVALEPVGRNVDASWLRVHVRGSRQLGWVPVDAAAVTCDVQPASLPLSHIPEVQTSQAAFSTANTRSVSTSGTCISYDATALKLDPISAGGWLLTDGQQNIQTFENWISAEIMLLQARQYNSLCFVEEGNAFNFVDDFIVVVR